MRVSPTPVAGSAGGSSTAAGTGRRSEAGSVRRDQHVHGAPAPDGRSGIAGPVRRLRVPVGLAWNSMKSRRSAESLRASAAGRTARSATDTVRQFLRFYVADCDGLDEARAEIRRTVRADSPALRRDRAALEIVLATQHPPGASLRLVEDDGNRDSTIPRTRGRRRSCVISPPSSLRCSTNRTDYPLDLSQHRAGSGTTNMRKSRRCALLERSPDQVGRHDLTRTRILDVGVSPSEGTA